MQRRTIVFGTGAVVVAAACGGGGDSPPADPVAQNKYAVVNLAASSASYNALITLPEMVGAWGVAIRPAGAGGHFWVGAANSSWEFIGDVQKNVDPALRVLSQDNLKRVTVPGTDGLTPPGAATGVVYNGASIDSANFPPTGQVMPIKTGEPATTAISGSSRFMFVTDSGYIGAWGERRTDTGAILRNDGAAARVYPPAGIEPSGAYFGVAMKTDTWDKMWVADFGADPQILQFNGAWEIEPTQGFVNPFATGPIIGTGTGAAKKPIPGDPVPFNIAVLGLRAFVAYAISRPDEADPTKFFVGEEDSLDPAAELATGNKPDKGKLVEYTLDGELVRIYKDNMRLNAPWGVEIAPKTFGKFSGAVLVANFGGAGYVSAFSSTTGEFLGYLNKAEGVPVAIEGIWSLQFGNGVSLGDTDALYFGAGPEGDNPSGLFGSIRYTPA